MGIGKQLAGVMSLGAGIAVARAVRRARRQRADLAARAHRQAGDESATIESEPDLRDARP